ncbi:competence protein CoiA family protein [Geminocystis sp. CENA526]|uniref:competence protein CoiA family protein n=1 Tax=Geminocystis sp. CENA526 TaxID=1355871 RepID=UPI003D6EAC41
MFYAKSMYLSQIISADDDNLDYSSYQRLGLRCLSCGEEVYLKKGEKNQPHFAHFKILENSPQNCSLRVFSDDLDSWRRLTIHGKNQRRRIFNQYFLDIINNTYPDFFIITNEVKENEKHEKTVKIIKESKQNIISSLRLINDSTEETILKNVIVIEIIDYLCLDHRKDTLLIIIKYLFKQNKAEDLTTICQLLVDFLKKVNWLLNYDLFSQKIILLSEDEKKNKLSKNKTEKKLKLQMV